MPICSRSERSSGARIASLLPGATEIVLALGLEDQLVAVSHSCDFPGRVSGLPRVTRTRVPLDAPSAEIDRVVRAALARGESLYEVDAERLDALAPDLIVTQGICQVCAVGPMAVERALPFLHSSPEILSLEPRTLEETFASIILVGEATDHRRRAERVVAGLRARVDAVRARRSAGAYRPRVAFLEWIDPPISGGHWNPELVALAGGDDGLGRPGVPSRTIAWEELLAWQPEVLVAACCGYSAERTGWELARFRARPGIAQLPCVRNRRVYAADGVLLFSRPGISLVESLERLERMIHQQPERLGTALCLENGAPEVLELASKEVEDGSFVVHDQDGGQERAPGHPTPPSR
jgi:iron complex transport system substrate-binding protein